MRKNEVVLDKEEKVYNPFILSNNTNEIILLKTKYNQNGIKNWFNHKPPVVKKIILLNEKYK
jgi:hypothetical protein